ncbi:hypothetical protein GMDG_03113 [Pseudogymnoascus destructans 20631-21]|uniref:Letm1 RBD domain-containing protein n=1 Tax=Pseudogymnoascus destructans (strain ATCC MYA-4855 / 20631-21) TaxID=658429 RepID=L8G6L1_PSED2|nr:hypothetical protein GMDG_03113 [Pseudogymnoascus destructans 20631-21]
MFTDEHHGLAHPAHLLAPPAQLPTRQHLPPAHQHLNPPQPATHPTRLLNRHHRVPHHGKTPQQPPQPARLDPPPPLVIPPKNPDQSFFRNLFNQGKGYLTFYKTGAQFIFTNLSLSHAPQELVDKKYDGAVYEAVRDRNFSRAHYQLLLRSWHDIKRLPVFALIFIVCGEFTPLIVFAFSSVVPYTCRVPRQIEADREKIEARRKTSFRNLTMAFTPGKELEREQLLHISWSLGLSSNMWDHIGGTPVALLKGRVASHVEYLQTDDRLIRRDGVLSDLEDEEVAIACTQRGIDVVGRSEEHLREMLEKWMAASKNTPMEKLLLTRPNVWPVPAKKGN